MTLLPLHILLAGGGTGGHLFPGIAIARKFLEKNQDSRILFVGTGNPFEISVLEKNGFEHKKITSAGIKGVSVFKKLKALLKIPKGLIESAMIIKSFRPDVVIGVGGYSSGPVVLMAWLIKQMSGKIKIALQEQNSLPGITNRILGRLSDRIYISFRMTAAFFNPAKVLYSGNPVREEILQARHESLPGKKNHTGNRFTVFVSGGSQGAHRVNIALIDALEYLESTDQFFFIHQTGVNDKEMVEAVYQGKGIKCDVRPFFDDMASQYEACDLLIARSGATTVSEITAMGKAVIFIPFPYASDNHQELNARELVKDGAADMILEKSLTGKCLAEKLEYYKANRDALLAMAEKSGNLGHLNASETIINDCYHMIERRV
ncbi:MAG: undecaprenyldiphospho-muramoylpentapeptide beta-N-acetylglucosaminyltransferase [Proteobacteria bacterium]|nr:undecaprenyldiphospho-muramoylpentapeptide beta-N-acetylglucosaminyltransferase [Pseudomonadota bacterium]